MQTREIAERYAVLIAGLTLMALGIALSIHAQLGITPISCPPYVLSLVPGWPTVGQFTICMHILFVLAQLVLLRKQFPKAQLLQVVMGIIFGLLIDGAVWLTSAIIPSTYWHQIVLVVTGSILIAIGVTLEVNAKVLLIAGEGLMLTIANISHTPFGHVKMAFDITLVSISLLCSILLFGHIEGVREGTLISALFVGFIAGKVQPPIGDPITQWLDRNKHQTATESKTQIRVVTIAREFGSGGHEIGQKLAQRLGWAFVDQLLIDSVACQEGFSADFVAKNDQQMSLAHRVWKDIWMDKIQNIDDSLSPEDQLFVAQGRIVRDEARRALGSKTGGCVIVGRCANHVLRDMPGCLHVFVSADLDFAVSRVSQEFGYTPERAAEKIHSVNASRAEHYNYYTGREWGNSADYDLTVHSSAIGVDSIVEMIAKMTGQKA